MISATSEKSSLKREPGARKSVDGSGSPTLRQLLARRFATEGIDAGADVARAAMHENVVLAPGYVFSVSQSASGFMRFNVAQMGSPPVFAALERAMAVEGPGGKR
jgi:hypothetical protein